jgi:hypothetical protein
MEELKKREKTWEFFLFWAEFDCEHPEDAKIPLGKKKRQSKGKEVVTPDKDEASTSKARRRIDFLDDPNDKYMVRMKRAKVETWKESLKEYRVLDRFLKK